ncbi:MAG: hypothetical protein ACM3OB_06230 [Acidobacteriota bacterium]
MSDTRAKDGSSGFNRRQVVVGGAALALLPVLERAARAQGVADAALAAVATAPARRGAAAAISGPISIGFLDGSDRLPDLHAVQSDLRLAADAQGAGLGAGFAVVPASELSSGDPSLADQPLRLRVLGLYPAVPYAGGPQKVDLEIEQPIDDLPGELAPFYAWSYRRKPLNVSPPVRFTATTSWQTPLSMVLRIVGAKGGAPTVLRSEFTMGDDSGRPRLQRGVYLLGLVGRPWDSDADLPADLAAASGKQFSLVLSVDPIVR